MKKLFSLLLAFSLILSLAACGGKPSKDGSAVETPPPVPAETVITPEPPSQTPDAVTPSASTEAPAAETPEPVPASPVPTEKPVEEEYPSQAGIDIDLSQMGDMMAYAELSNIVYYADDYVGKVIRMTGTAVSYYDEQTDAQYYAVMILDATACCSSGFDLLLAEGQAFPENGQEITVTGELEMYEVYEGIQFLRLKDARIDAQQH